MFRGCGWLLRRVFFFFFFRPARGTSAAQNEPGRREPSLEQQGTPAFFHSFVFLRLSVRGRGRTASCVVYRCVATLGVSLSATGLFRFVQSRESGWDGQVMRSSVEGRRKLTHAAEKQDLVRLTRGRIWCATPGRYTPTFPNDSVCSCWGRSWTGPLRAGVARGRFLLSPLLCVCPEKQQRRVCFRPAFGVLAISLSLSEAATSLLNRLVFLQSSKAALVN